ncbi:MAG: hypothetical protein ACKVZ0_19150 [Gemmatimonadales bacterium]
MRCNDGVKLLALIRFGQLGDQSKGTGPTSKIRRSSSARARETAKDAKVARFELLHDRAHAAKRPPA